MLYYTSDRPPAEPYTFFYNTHLFLIRSLEFSRDQSDRLRPSLKTRSPQRRLKTHLKDFYSNLRCLWMLSGFEAIVQLRRPWIRVNLRVIRKPHTPQMDLRKRIHMLRCVYQCICLLHAKQSRIRAFGSGQENSSTMNNKSSAFLILTAAVSGGNERKPISSLCQGSCSQCQFCTLPGCISLPTTPERKRGRARQKER